MSVCVCFLTYPRFNPSLRTQSQTIRSGTILKTTVCSTVDTRYTFVEILHKRCGYTRNRFGLNTP